MAYRESSGSACLRCERVAMLDDAGQLSCPDGCGTWFPRAAMKKQFGFADISRRGTTAPYFKVTPLPATRCLVCDAALMPHYRRHGRSYLAVGECPEHGVWIERGTAAELASALEVNEAERRRAARDEPEVRPLASEERIQILERRVNELMERVEELEKRR